MPCAPGPAGRTTPARHMRELDRAEALRLLATVSLGRIVFTHRALPAVRPVNHLVDGEDVVIRIHGGGALASLSAPADAPGVVVAYEADAMDPDTHLGWSVVVTGYAQPVLDANDLDRYANLLHPWVERATTTATLRIHPDLVTGFRPRRESRP
ncbi:pyridoxamine 5'-phosphate oxidase [Streptomyces katrae]|uniref:Pyridoxamine 5'-phosphate oxidase n=2 Tax=Streptomyces katrae TaxID=68223 RepID=A0A0F4JNX2_9ACTN|nr:pyridoxamine 5'-phosphate oxidase [Streptomyces katrae]